MSRTLRALLAIGLIALPFPLLPAGKPTGQTAFDVTTTIYDTSGSTTLLMKSDDYNGSGFATYVVTGKKSSVTSSIDADGNWSLSWGSPRSIWLTPDQPVGSQPSSPVPIPAAGYYNYAGQAHGICRTPDGAALPFPTLGMGITYSCQMGLEFHYAGLVYKFAMGPALPWAGPATGNAAVTCNAVTNNQCSDWTIASTADSNGQNANVANLYYYTSQWVFLGQYYNSFVIRVTKP